MAKEKLINEVTGKAESSIARHKRNYFVAKCESHNKPFRRKLLDVIGLDHPVFGCDDCFAERYDDVALEAELIAA